MPLYEYACESCGEHFEVRQKFSDEPLTTHDKCGGKVDRLLSVPALQFKGSGFYITDYAKNSGTPATPAKKTEGNSGAGADSSSSTPAAPAASETKSTSDNSKTNS